MREIYLENYRHNDKNERMSSYKQTAGKHQVKKKEEDGENEDVAENCYSCAMKQLSHCLSNKAGQTSTDTSATA